MNNVASFKDWISGVLYETKYTYDKDSRQTSTVGAGLTRLWNYDAYGRTKEIITKDAAGQQILKSEPVYPIPDSTHTIPRANGWRNSMLSVLLRILAMAKALSMLLYHLQDNMWK
jgi:hypothetical protein